MPADASDIVIYLRLRDDSFEEADQVSIDGLERHAELVAVLCQELGSRELTRLVLFARRYYSLLEIGGAVGGVDRSHIVKPLFRLDKGLQHALINVPVTPIIHVQALGLHITVIDLLPMIEVDEVEEGLDDHFVAARDNGLPVELRTLLFLLHRRLGRLLDHFREQQSLSRLHGQIVMQYELLAVEDYDLGQVHKRQVLEVQE